MSASTGSGHRVTTAYSRDVAKPEIEVPFKGTGIGITLVSLGAHHGRSAPKIPATSQGLSKAPAFSRVATAQTYASCPITMIVRFPPGSGLDTVARIIVEPIRVSLGRPIIIENVTGAGGSIGVVGGYQAAVKLAVPSTSRFRPGSFSVRAADTRAACRLSETRDREMVVDHEAHLSDRRSADVQIAQEPNG